MKIRVCVLDRDIRFLQRLSASFEGDYSEKMSISSFSTLEKALDYISGEGADVFLASKDFEINRKEVPANCAFAYLVDSKDIVSYKDEPAVCKFQMKEAFYRQIVSLFSDVANDITGFARMKNENISILGFVSASGGTGCSTAAAAAAIHLSKAGKKVLYLNFEKLGDPNLYFSAEGKESFRDVIFAVKSRKANLSLKLASTVKKDKTGVYFYATVPLALDLAELTLPEIQEIIDTLKESGEYEYIILDLDFSLQKDSLTLLNCCDDIIFVSDGSPISNSKLQRAVDSLRILEEQESLSIMAYTSLLYNRFSSKNSAKVQIEGMHELGGIKRFEGYNELELLDVLSENAVFDSLMRG